jgi:hypothetical protein
VFSIVPPGEATTEFNWLREVSEDSIKPEPFSVELVRDESVYEGKWFIVFNTLDKQSGIDHFEVYETAIENEGFVFGKDGVASIWKDARSPYLLEDQSLNSVIRVRAYDKAGNDRIGALIPDQSLREVTKPPLSKSLFVIVVGLLALLFIGLVVFLMYRKLSKRNEEERDTILFKENGDSENDIAEQSTVESHHNEGYESDENS